MHGSDPGHNYDYIVSDSAGGGTVARDFELVSWEPLWMEARTLSIG
jgi:hypothetical protein